MATITEVGTASGVVKYEGDTVMYVPKMMLTHWCPVQTDRLKVGCGSYQMEWKFDDETQRDAAIATILGYY